MFQRLYKSYQGNKRRARQVLVVVTATGAVSVGTRRWRQQHMDQLPLATETLLSAENKHHTTVEELILTLSRARLMGTTMSVAQELDEIRKWHHDHGYKGGLVLRELQQPVFSHNQQENTAVAEFDMMDAMALARRESYYLYYEIKSNGHKRQQIFCRGTTLGVDIMTCLETWWIYDEDLGCRVHRGFANHANRLLQDILPLLAPPNDERATIEVSGHSLGGAVAFLLAIKLKLLGYNVVKLTTVAAPRFCTADGVNKLTPLLPPDTLRIEDDGDVVPMLPPFGHHVGDKLWLVSNGPARYVPWNLPDSWWVDSFFINFRFLEILSSFSQNHRVGSHIAQLQRLADSTATAENGGISSIVSD